MTGVASIVDLVLAACLAALLSSIVLRRLAVSRRRRRVARIRERLEPAIASYLIEDGARPPVLAGRLELATLREVALEAFLELRGGERERLTQLLERAGVVDASMRQLRRGRTVTRRRAADALAVIRSARAVGVLLEALLSDRDGTVRVAAARALVELGDPVFVARVLPVAAAEVDARPGAIADVLLAVGAREPQVLGEILLTTRVPGVRRLAAAVIGELRLAEHATALRQVLGEDDELAARAARGLGMIGDADSVDDLLELAADRGRPEFVRAVATKALGQIGDPRAVDPLRRQLTAPDSGWQLREAAAEGLANLGADGRDALESALRAESGDARRHAAVALEA